MTLFEPGPSTAPAPDLHRFSVIDVVVRHALRRDLTRLIRVLGEPVTAVRRTALADHVTFLLDQLQAHHRLLDDAMWPTVVAHRPDLADLGEQGRRSHSELGDSLLRVRRASLEWRGSAGKRAAVLAAVRDLTGRLHPVLDQDAELVPLACSMLPTADRLDLDRRTRPSGPTRPARRTIWLFDELNPRPWRAGGPTRLARRTFWLLDELDARQAGLLLQHTPRAAMWILRNGFSGAYNRGAYLMWVGGGTGPAI